MSVYASNGRRELTLRQRRLVSSEIAKEFKAWRRKKGEPSEADRQQIVAIGFAQARRKMPSIPAANPSPLAAAIGGATGALVMNALANPKRRKSNPSSAILSGDQLDELQAAAHSYLDPSEIYWVITGPVDGVYSLRVDNRDLERARILIGTAVSLGLGVAANPVGEESSEHPTYRFYGNLYADSDRSKMTLEAFRDAGVKFISEGKGGNLLDVYVQRDDWGRAILAAEGVIKYLRREYGYGENPAIKYIGSGGYVRRETTSGPVTLAPLEGEAMDVDIQGAAKIRATDHAFDVLKENPPRPNSHLEGEPCDVCGGPLNFMGTLGTLEWYRCRNCGTEIQSQAPRENPVTRRTAEGIHVSPRLASAPGLTDATGLEITTRDRAGRREADLLAHSVDVRDVYQNPGKRLVLGSRLPYQLQQEVLRRYIYRWTVDNLDRARVYRCPVCEVPGGDPSGDVACRQYHPTIPLITDAEWLATHSFEVTKDGRLSARQHHAEPGFMATENPQANPVLMTVMGANPRRRRRSNPGRRSSGPVRRKTTMSLERFAQFVKAKNDPKLWAAFVKKVRGYQKWTHGSMPKSVTIETMNVPGVQGLWMTYGMGREPEKVYVMPKGSKRKGAWKHPWGKMPHLKGDPEAGVILTKLVKGNRITDFLHG